ncbi:cell division ABC transporter subunit FtsX [Methyloligella halotolerans]|uniref:Cell division ABC transporter subunit FtsX n=1 Tax=Methyloligella halotolerans TaxID=1177755 RepID=A0A1E2RVR6_9HYPH|nr:FtsX-like permease family protein [Methyloligella halotolerans]ODA66220.1 cell division ABC transporter subunit FtsX [Methyloligella halotolerans]
MSEPAKASDPSFWLPLKIALRELRSGAGGLSVFVICIALGVASIAAIGSLAAAFDAALVNSGRTLVGGDLSFELVHRQATDDEAKALNELGEISESASLRAMAHAKKDKSALVEIKAVDAAFPLFGNVEILEPKDAGPLWRKPGNVIVEQSLLDRLNLKIGDKLTIGEGNVTIAGILGDQPDRLADRLAYGPRVLMSLDTLEQTALIQPGSLIRWTYRLRLPGELGTDRDVLAATKAKVQERFPESGFAVNDWTDPAPRLRRNADRFTQFISLVGLTALLLGGIGVGNAIHAYMNRKREVIAIFKSLGATSKLVLRVYLLQALLLTAIGILIGLIVGAATPAIMSALYADRLPIALVTSVHPVPLLMAAGAGLLTMALFVLWPLGRASAVPPAVLMRSHLAEEDRFTTAWPFAVGSGLSGFALFALAVATSSEPLITGLICLGIVVAFGVLYVIGWGLQALAALLRPRVPPTLALAFASIGGPGSLARNVALSLGLGLGLLVAVALIDRALVAELQGDLAADAPSYYFLDIDAGDIGRFRETAKSVLPDVELNDAPMLRGRIVRLNGVSVDEIEASPEYQWVINGDRGLTYTAEVPDGSKVVAGEWWPKDYDGPPLVSFDDKAAEGLGLHLGDLVTVNILGRNIEASVSNLREIDWESLAINFIMVFPPSTLKGVPHRALATLEFPEGTTPEQEGKLIQTLAEAFPLVTAIKVGDVVDAAQKLIGQVMTAIQVTAGITLLIGAVVLAGAIASGQQRRQYLAVLYKTLGATRRRIVTAELVEFAFLGLSVAVAAVAIATLTAFVLCVFVFDIPFRFSALAAGETVLLALGLVLGLGLVAIWRVLSAKAAPYLRAE